LIIATGFRVIPISEFMVYNTNLRKI